MKRIVLKVGSSVLTHKGEGIAKERVLNLVTLIAKLKKKYEIILITSGAVSAGYSVLKLNKDNHLNKRILASIGQPILMSSYKRKFDIYDIDTSQILLTEEDLKCDRNKNIFVEMINITLKNNIVPIINENDISSMPEHLFGDNDQLSAHITQHTSADLLVLLSDVDGYYDDNPNINPNAKLKKIVNRVSKEEIKKDVTPNYQFATGGIVTKLKSAKYLLKNNKKMFLCSGFDLEDIESFLLKNVHLKGTLFSAE